MSQPAAAQPVSADATQIDADSMFAARADERRAFLDNNEWSESDIVPMGEDCAFRRYYRVTDPDGNIAVMMDSIPELEGLVTPSHQLKDYVPMAQHMRNMGLSTPEVFAVDLEHGYALLEDFGDVSYNKLLASGHDEKALYELGTDVLRHIRMSKDALSIDVLRYFDSHVHSGRTRIVSWYLPAVRHAPNEEGLMESYLAAWAEVENNLPAPAETLVHCDYHVDNLMYLEDRQGMNRCGILDFQGAVKGPMAYDMSNLLEDARRVIPADLKEHLKARYCEGMSAEERESFNAWFRVLGTQFHCRVIGQFVRLLIRDNKPVYMSHVPRLANYIKEGLQDPVLAPMKRWFDENGVDLDRPLTDVDPDEIRPFITADGA